MKWRLGLFLIALPAFAQAEPITVGSPCPAPAEVQAAPDVAYTPGLDANGKPVKPADLHPPILSDKEVADSAYTHLGVPLNKYVHGDSYNFPMSDQATVDVGVVSMHDGKASLNGQSLEEKPEGCK